MAFATGKVREGGAATVSRPGVNELRRDASRSARRREDAAQILAATQLGRANGAQAVIAYQHNHDWEPSDWRMFRPGGAALAHRCVAAGALGVRRPWRAAAAGRRDPSRRRSAVLRPGQFQYFQTERAARAYPPEAWEGVMESTAPSTAAGFGRRD
ncbi:hypothetical protein ACRAWD_29785 [Caulobacter segnis]